MTNKIALDAHLCFKLYVASRLVIRGYGEPLAPLDLTYPKYVVLLAISEADGLTVGALVERLSLDFGTVSPLLKSLEASGYVERRRSPADERSVTAHITASGRATLEKAQGVAFDLFCQTEMQEKDFRDLRDRLDDYIGRCQKVVKGKQTTKKGARV